MRRCLCVLAVSAIVGSVSNVMAADPAAWLPPNINAVARINVADIYKSPLAQKEGWVKKATESFVQQEAFVPPGTKQIFVGAELELAKGLMANQKYSVLVPDGQLTLEKLSSWLPGQLEKYEGKTLGNFGQSGYVADAGDGCWLTTGSPSRQMITRWLKSGPTSPGVPTSKYLKSALASRDNTAQVILAIDLQDNFAAPLITEHLKSTDWFKGGSGVDATAKVLESVQGVTISLSVGEDRAGKVTIDFANDTAPLKPILDKLIDVVLDAVGASDGDMKSWKWTAQGKTVTGGGSASVGAGRRILSVLDPPSITQAMADGTAPPANDNTEAAKKASVKYFKSAKTLIDDMHKALDNTANSSTTYLDRYARKLDDLPTLNVDKALLDFSSNVSRSFRYQAQSERMAKIGAGTSVISTYGNSSSYGNIGPYGSYGPVGLGAAASINAQANMAYKDVRLSEWVKIENGMVTLRREMTDKYKVEF